MRAIRLPIYGGPEVLRIADIARPTPKADEVLIQVAAASVNPADLHRMRGTPWAFRLSEGVFKPKNPAFGSDVYGKVIELGQEVKGFQEGDVVFGEIGTGAFAEYATAQARLLCKAPGNLGSEVAAVPIAGVAALQGLRYKRPVQSGQRVLVNGASGGVGSFAAQIAKAWGAEVTAVCSTRNIARMRSIGADVTVDYTQNPFDRLAPGYDFILDAYGNLDVADIQAKLTPQGVGALVGFSTMGHLAKFALQGRRASRAGGQHIGVMGSAAPHARHLQELKGLMSEGKVTPLIDRSYSLDNIGEAIRYLEEGHAQGKVLITIGQNLD